MKANRAWIAAVSSIFLILTDSVSFGETDLTVEDRAKMGEIYSLERLQRYDEVKPLIAALRSRYPENSEIKWTQARILGFSGSWEEASGIFDELCADECEKEIVVTYGHILESQGSNPGTLSHIKKLVDRYPDYEKLQSIYIQILSWNGQNPEGRAALEKLHEQFPEDLKIIAALGDAAYAAEKYTLAEKYYRHFLSQEMSPDVHNKFINTLISQKKHVEAIEEMDRLLLEDPQNPDLRHQYARVLSTAGKHEEAVSELKTLLQEGYQKKEALVLLGDELRLLGRNDEALKVYREVTNAD
ncbi:MAG: tetratricopeptide repeat protein [Candidatus Omnitrophota bacterium]